MYITKCNRINVTINLGDGQSNCLLLFTSSLYEQQRRSNINYHYFLFKMLDLHTITLLVIHYATHPKKVARPNLVHR